MGRLTERYPDGTPFLPNDFVLGSANGISNVIKKLTDYEDLEEQGLLLRLPCKVGDTVWCICDKKVNEAIARKVTVVTGLNNYTLVKVEAEFDILDPFYSDGRTTKYGVYANYLETVFLTKAEAEEALKKMQEGCDE